MLDDGVKVVAIAEALGITRQRVYVIKRGYTPRERRYRNHFVNCHSFREDCPYCQEEKNQKL